MSVEMVMAAMLAAFFIGAVVSLAAVVLGAWIASRFIKTGQPLFAAEEAGSYIETDAGEDPLPGRRSAEDRKADEPLNPDVSDILLRQNSKFLQQIHQSLEPKGKEVETHAA